MNGGSWVREGGEGAPAGQPDDGEHKPPSQANAPERGLLPGGAHEAQDLHPRRHAIAEMQKQKPAEDESGGGKIMARAGAAPATAAMFFRRRGKVG